MAYQFDIKVVQDDVEEMCERHVDIQHNVDGKKAFVRFETGEQISDVKKNQGKVIVVVASFTGRRVGTKDDYALQREMILRVAKFSETIGSVISAKNAAIRAAEEVMFDLWSEMEHRQENDIDTLEGECSMWRFLRPEDMFWEEIEDQPWLVNHYGWDLHVIFRTPMPKHNAEKWLDEASGIPGDDDVNIFSPSNFVAEFRVGAPGAPMAEGDLQYTNELLRNRKFTVLASGIKISGLTDVDAERYCTKDFDSPTIFFHGGVKDGEVISIYKN